MERVTHLELQECMEAALGEGPAAAEATRRLFRDWVEPLSDGFTAEGVREYVEGFAPLVARVLPGWRAEDVAGRFEGVRRVRRFAGDAAAVRDVVVLSRVTLGADVAVTSVLMDAARRAFPNAVVHLAGNAKNAEVFAGEARVRHLAAPYARTGLLRDRLRASASLAGMIPEGAVVMDPDSRLSQLGLVPVCSDEQYFFFDSRSVGGEGDSAGGAGEAGAGAGDGGAGAGEAGAGAGEPTIGELAAAWCERCFGVRGRAWIAPVGGVGGAVGEPRVCVSLGTGENPGKGLGAEFEAELMRRLVAAGRPVLVDKGMGGDEGERVDRAIAASGAAAGQVATWLGPFAPFAFETARAPLYVGYDSAGQHVAAAAGTRLRCIFAGAPSERFFARWRPWGEGEAVTIRVKAEENWREALDALRLAE